MKANSTFLYLISIVFTVLLFQGCGDSSIGTETESQIPSSAEIFPGFAQKTDGPSPQEVHDNFVAMVEKVQQMSREEIEAMSDEEILKLGKPILTATENTIKLSDKTLQELKAPASEMADRIRSITKKEYNELSNKFLQVIRKNESDQPTLRNLDSSTLKTILLDYADSDSGTMQMLSTCSSMYNTMGTFVFLYPGDNLNTANSVCDAGSTFYVHQGTYYSQKVENSKNGNEWVGISGPVLDGQNSVNRAFQNGMKNSIINGLIIKKYTEYGIYSTTSSTQDVYIVYMTFEKIGFNKNGEIFGAIRFDNAEDLSVRNSYFEDVASGILFNDTDGPLEVLNNEALNSGRNFFQCGNCNGGGIRINGNSMDRISSSYGSEELEDWISIFESEGLQSDWIQVKNNRARGHSTSKYGSFLILGDSGGKYQKASENIGVNPGQVGIGVAGGQYMRVEDNKMFSVQWASSNVAFYSADYSSPAPCSNHEFPASPNPNVAHWKNSSGVLNRANSDGKCGITVGQIRSNVDEDTNMDEDIWNDW